MLHELKRTLVPSSVNTADIVSGIVVGVDMIRLYCKHLKYIKNLYLLTNGRYKSPLSESETDLNAIKEEMINSNIQFKVLGVDFDDDETGFIEEGEPDPAKKQSEAVIKSICDIPDSIFANVEEAINSLQEPTVKKPRPIKTFAGNLVLGDATAYTSNNVLSINIEAFPCTRVAAPPTATAYATAGKPAQSQAPTQAADSDSKLKNTGLQEVKRLTEYFVKDEEAPGGQAEIEADEVEAGYRFGSEIVFLSPEEGVVLQAVNAQPASMLIVGFVKEKDVPRYMSMSNTDYVTSARGDARASLALSSLVHAVYLENSAIIVRFIQKENKEVKMCVLTPVIEENFEGFVLSRLPFAQDQRHYRFPPLGEVRIRSKETGGFKTVKEHPVMIPTDDMQEAMDQFVDHMDLMEADDDGFEYASPDQVYNPLIHRIKHVVKFCALMDNTENLPDMLSVLRKYANPPESLLSKAESTISKLDELLATKRVETKEERKQRIKREKESKSDGNFAQKQEEVVVEEKAIDLDNILARASTTQSQTQGSEDDLVKRESNSSNTAGPTSQPGPDLVHLSTSATDIKVSAISPVTDFQNAINLASSSASPAAKDQILVSACTQVMDILAELFEIAVAPNPPIDSTISSLLGDLVRAAKMTGSGEQRRLVFNLKAKLDDLVESEEIGEHLTEEVSGVLDELGKL